MLKDGDTSKVAIVVLKLPPGKSNVQVLFGELSKVSQKKRGNLNQLIEEVLNSLTMLKSQSASSENGLNPGVKYLD